MTLSVKRLLCAVVMALVCTIVAELRWERVDPVRTSAKDEVQAASKPEPLGPLPQQVEAWAAIVLARPLFAPGRQPAPPEVAASAPLPDLTGIIVSPAGRRAIFALGGKSLTVDEGAPVEGWTLQAVGDGKVTLLGPDGIRILALTFRTPRVSESTAISSGIPSNRRRTHTRT